MSIDWNNPATWPAWVKNDTRLSGKLSDLNEVEQERTDAAK